MNSTWSTFRTDCQCSTHYQRIRKIVMIIVMSKKTTKVVIVGGGFGGVKAALELANKPGFEVRLISDNTHFEYHGALYRSAVGHSPMEVVIPLKDIFAHAKNVEVILDSAGFLDLKQKRIASLTGNIYSFDKAVFALGNTVNYFGVEGLEEHTETMHDISSTIQLRKALVELLKTERKKPIRIAVIGAGASGVELSGEIPNFAALVAKKYKIKKPQTKIVLIDSAPRVLPMLSEKASAKTAKHLNGLGVEIHLNMQVEACKKGELCMSAGDLKADLLVWTAGSKPVDFFAKNPTAFTLGRGGRVVVDEYLQPVGHKDIYVLGDNADTPYSGMAQTALHNAIFIAKNIIAEHSGKSAKPYRSRKPLYVVTAGPKWAIVQKGERVISGYRGWVIRRQADLAIFRYFQPYKQAVKTWRRANRMSNF